MDAHKTWLNLATLRRRGWTTHDIIVALRGEDTYRELGIGRFKVRASTAAAVKALLYRDRPTTAPKLRCAICGDFLREHSLTARCEKGKT